MTAAGRSVVVCRATHQAAPLLDRLIEIGFVPVHVPLIEVVAPDDGGTDLRRHIESADASTWIALTSGNGVDAVASVLEGRPPVGRVAVVGAATAARARSLGWSIDTVAPASSAAGLGAALPAAPGERVIAAIAELASSDLADALRARDIAVEVVTAYRTIAPEISADDLRRIADSDAVLVTAPSVIQRLSRVLDPAGLPSLIAIGSTSAAAIEAAGLPVAAQASEQSVDGLIDALMRTLGP